MPNNGTLIGSPTFGAVTAHGTFAATALTLDGSGQRVSLPVSAFPLTANWTAEFWFKTTDTAVSTPFWGSGSGTGNYIVAINATAATFICGAIYNLTGPGPGGATFPATSGVVNDNAWHHVALVSNVTGNSGTIYLDGVQIGASTGGTYTVLAALQLFIGAANDGTNPYTGVIQEFALWSGLKYTGTFTPGTAPYTGTESNLLGLYHLATNANDSSNPGDLFAADTAAIHYSPGVVRVPGGGTTILMEQASNARFNFTGTSLKARVDVAGLQASAISGTPSSWPNLYAIIDGGARLGPFQVTAPGSGTVQNIALVSGLSAGTHTAVVYYEEISGQDTYTHSLYTTLIGFVVDTGSTVSVPTGSAVPATDQAILFGNSFAWGSQGLAINSNPYYQGYTQFLASDLSVDLGVVGKPGQGLATNNGGSPVASGPLGKDSYPNYDSTHARPALLGKKYIIFEWGINDTGDMTAQVTATSIAARTLFGPVPFIVWLLPPNLTHLSEIRAGVAATGDTKCVAVLCNATYTTNDGTHPNAAGHAAIGHGFATSILQATGQATNHSYDVPIWVQQIQVQGVLLAPVGEKIPGLGLGNFRATVIGIGGIGQISQAGTWTTTAGSVDASGVATAPAASGSDQTVTLTFTSTQDNTVSGTIAYTVPKTASEPDINAATMSDVSSVEPVTLDAVIQNWQTMCGLVIGGTGRVLARGEDGRDHAFNISRAGSVIPGRFVIVRTSGTTATAISAGFRNR